MTDTGTGRDILLTILVIVMIVIGVHVVTALDRIAAAQEIIASPPKEVK